MIRRTFSDTESPCFKTVGQCFHFGQLLFTANGRKQHNGNTRSKNNNNTTYT